MGDLPLFRKDIFFSFTPGKIHEPGEENQLVAPPSSFTGMKFIPIGDYHHST
jgi:hypothetical protein